MKKILKSLFIITLVFFLPAQNSYATTKKKPLTTKVSISKNKISSILNLSNVNECKLKDPGNDDNIYQHMGFSDINNNILNKKNISVQVIPVNFLDLKDTLTPKQNVNKFINDSVSFYNHSSNGKINLNWLVPDEYIELPKTIGEYPLVSAGSRSNNGSFFMSHVIDFAKNEIDLSTADFIVIALPSNVSNKQSDFSPAVYIPRDVINPLTQDKVYRTTMIGGDIRVNNNSMMLIHEFGHLFGLKDYYNFDWKQEDSYELQFKYLGYFSLMSSPIAPELLAWDKWILNFINDKQVRCINKPSTTKHLITPISRSTNLVQAVVVTISDTEALVVESRFPEGNDIGLSKVNKKGGVLVYKINTLAYGGQGPAEIIVKYGGRDKMHSDSLLQVNEEIIFKGITVKNIETGKFGNIVQIQKAY
jgi:M6 family metalloprotease-like protein